MNFLYLQMASLCLFTRFLDPQTEFLDLHELLDLLTRFLAILVRFLDFF